MTVIFCILLVIAGFIMIWMYAHILALECRFKEERRALSIIGTAFPKYFFLYHKTKSLMHHGYPLNKIIEILRQNRNGDTEMTITKEEAIKTLQELWRETNNSWYEETYNMAIEALKKPSNATQLLDDGTLKVKVANVLDIKRVMVMDDNVIYDSYYPDRPKGEWIVSKNGKYITCSNCGLEMFHSDWAYCPICGADMRNEVM